MRVWPKTLRTRLIVLIVAIALPALISGSFSILLAERALVAEKQEKLFGVTRMLDHYLQGSFDDLLITHEERIADRVHKIDILNQRLSAVTDQVCQAYPGIGAGYYSKSLDGIITYGPSHSYGTTVGLPISANHEGRMVMATGQPRIQEGELVRGAIMNVMYPIIRRQEVIGYIWANELTSDIELQLRTMRHNILLALTIGILFGLAGVVLLVDRLIADINGIKQGLVGLKQDLNYQLPSLTGELGEITAAINDMAQGLIAKQQLEDQVQRVERLALAGELAAGLAHEIRNPLMAVKGFAQLLQEQVTPYEQAQYSAIIVRETQRMNRLVEELLYFARPVAAGTGGADIHTVIRESLSLLEPKAMRTQIEITSCLAPDLPAVAADRERLKQVVVNLLINAFQAVGEQGSITVHALLNATTGMVEIQITDSGVGISPEHIGKLFNPFFTTREDGAGLGLSVAQRLMSGWGGEILVDSTLGQGSTFTLVLPQQKEGSDETTGSGS